MMATSMQPGARVRIVAREDLLPQTLIRFVGRVCVLIQWEDEIAVCRFGDRVVLVAAGHLEVVE